MTKLTTVAILALASSAFLATSALAQNVTFSSGDLILSFRDGGKKGTTAVNNLEVDLGSAASFNFSSAATITQFNSADLTTVFGSSWNTDSTLRFSIAGSDTTTAYNLYLSNPSNGFTMPTLGGTVAQAGIVGHIYTATGSTALTASNNSTELAATTSTSYSSAIYNVNKTYGASTYNSDYNFSLPGSTETLVSSTGSVTTDLYKLSSGSTVDLGTFSLSSAGVLSFTPQAVPEPSSYALLVIAIGALCFLRRRYAVKA